MIKKSLFLICIFITSISLMAQEIEWPQADVSVMDAIYYPQEVAWRNYLDQDQRNINPKIKVLYSRPMKKGRTLFGGLVPYGKEWRLGANEATQITFYQPVRIGKKTVAAGVYTLFAEINPVNWTFHISKETGIWGNANRDLDATVASITVPSLMVEEGLEALSMTFQKVDDLHVNLIVQWDQTQSALPISFDPISFASIDASPMDMAHYPGKSAYTNYLEGNEKDINPKIQVVYSRPAKKGRDVFGGLLKMGDIWRIGANEASEIVFYQNVKVGDTELARGRYAMFAELHEDYWEIIFSKDYPIWGVANRDMTKDVARAKATVSNDTKELEHLSIIFNEKSPEAIDLVIGWDKTRATLPITLQ